MLILETSVSALFISNSREHLLILLCTLFLVLLLFLFTILWQLLTRNIFVYFLCLRLRLHSFLGKSKYWGLLKTWIAILGYELANKFIHAHLFYIFPFLLNFFFSILHIFFQSILDYDGAIVHMFLILTVKDPWGQQWIYNSTRLNIKHAFNEVSVENFFIAELRHERSVLLRWAEPISMSFINLTLSKSISSILLLL